MSWVAAAIAGGAIISGVLSSKAAGNAANAQQQSADAATNEQRRQYDLTRSDFAPWRTAGEGALNRLTTASTGDTSSFFTSPDYNFTRTEGNRDIGSSFAARGGAASGNALRALAEFNNGLASRQYSDWWNRQAGLAGVGQQATGSTAAAGQNAANNISQNYLASGDARASGIIGSANSWSNSLNSGLNNYLLYRGGYFGK
jgi:hypothetical protein